MDDLPVIDDMPVIDDRATLVIRLLPPAPQGHCRRCAEMAFGPVIIQVDAEVWESLNSDVSRAFVKPKSGRIAVKVINHLGDEVMKVFGV